MDAIGADEVHAESGIDRRSDHEWIDRPAFLFQDAVSALLGPLESLVGFASGK
jgi:hypothetical protein